MLRRLLSISLTATCLVVTATSWAVGTKSSSRRSSRDEWKPRHRVESRERDDWDYKRGMEFTERGDWDNAIRSFKKTANRRESYPEAYNMLGYAYRKRAHKDLQRSEEAYSEALKQRPNFEEALEYQGELFIRLGRLREAYANYEQLRKADSEEAEELLEKLEQVLEEATAVQKERSKSEQPE